MEIKQINNPKHSNDRVYDSSGISPTLNTMQGGNRQPFIKVVAHDNSKFESNGRIYGSSGISPCQSARQYKDPIKMLDEEEMRIRKLTPTECERLMAWRTTLQNTVQIQKVKLTKCPIQDVTSIVEME